jgi:hypothetical protein
VPALDPQRQGRYVPLVSYLTSPRTHEPTDPLEGVDKVPLGTPFAQKEAACVVRKDDRYLIIDGTTRCILFLRSGDLDAQLQV